MNPDLGKERKEIKKTKINVYTNLLKLNLKLMEFGISGIASSFFEPSTFEHEVNKQMIKYKI